ncbi:M48 family metallopeptidase [Bifidobacterium rousetti]|uniref:M48 family metallopeptidase n=1 Tax=Bifidobacterium rousetti TaxID=2045439 RepID=UPI001CC327DA|nr:YgjP-like metallopeptidase domain-containing protein [Bifidobacterium rousetti]
MPYRRRPSRISPIPAVISTRVIDVDGMPVEVTRKRIRNMYLRIKPPAGEIVVSAPARMPERTIVGFVRGRREWIEQQRERMAQARREAMAGLIADDGDSGGLGDDLFTAGGLEPIDVGSGDAGADAVGHVGRTGRAGVSGGSGSAGVDGKPDGAGPESPNSPASPAPLGSDDGMDGSIEPIWTDERRKRAEDAINAALPGLLAKWTPVVGKSPTHITLRLMTSRWGSCTPKTGRIRLNLQLGLMEPEFLEYVLVHELTHLWERGHGERFRARMDAYLPRWRELRRELNRRIVL